MTRLIDVDKLKEYIDDCECCEKCDKKGFMCNEYCELPDCVTPQWERVLNEQPTVDAEPVPVGGIGEISDGFHTFNGLYYQRMMLFAALVKTYKDRSWKSRRHSDGEPCFGGGWFIVGIDTPQGSYTYHYEDKYFDLFDCVELSKGKEWDGHTEDDVTRLLSLNAVPVRHGKWLPLPYDSGGYWKCSDCGTPTEASGANVIYKYCPFCGAKMGEAE